MNIQFKNSHGGLYPALQERIERKLTKFSKLADTKESSAFALVELAKEVGSHQNGDVWQATINIDSNGNRYHSAELAKTPEKATALALKEIYRELKRARGKRQTLLKRGGGFWKSFARLS